MTTRTSARLTRLARSAALFGAMAVLPGCASFGRGGGGTGGGGSAPESFMRLGTEAETQRMVSVRDGLTRATAFRTAVDYLTEKGYTIEARDAVAGFLMTGWQATLARDGVPDLRYRTRLMLKFTGEDWRLLQLRADANWRDGDTWQVGVDRALLDAVAAELRTRLGPR